jgi:hypothetical protein
MKIASSFRSAFENGARFETSETWTKIQGTQSRFQIYVDPLDQDWGLQKFPQFSALNEGSPWLDQDLDLDFIDQDPQKLI